VWSAARWGRGPGIAAALASGLFFDFFFTPPYYTFVVSRLEDWLILAIFLAVAIVVVDRIHTNLSMAQKSEHEAVFMYELSTMLAAARTQDAVAHGVARFLKERYLTSAVTVSIHPKGQAAATVALEPREAEPTTQPDRILGLLNAWGMVGEVNIWQGQLELPAEDSRLFRNFASQIGQAIERTLFYEAEAQKNAAFQSN
jgi:two-component system, OmpR family, sensor histidine kinase KdpD